jgi:hypothetical protein
LSNRIAGHNDVPVVIEVLRDDDNEALQIGQPGFSDEINGMEACRCGANDDGIDAAVVV